jgi:hypothetical protein
MAVIQFIGKNSCDFFPPYFRFFNKINVMAIISKFYIMDLGATLLAETEILPFWRSNLRVF